MASCTDEYKRLNAELDKLINYKHSFDLYVETNRAAAYEAEVATREITRIRKELEDLKVKAKTAEQLATQAGAEAAKVALDKQEAAKAEEEAKKKSRCRSKNSWSIGSSIIIIRKPSKSC